MGQLAAQVRESRAQRNAARMAFNARVEQVKQDLDSRSIAGRIADKIECEARESLEEAKEIASESKGIAAGTVAALALWFLRAPVWRWVEGLFAQDDEEEGEDSAVAEAAPDAEPGEPLAALETDVQDVTNS